MIQWLHLQIKCLDLFGHRLTLEAVSYIVIVMFDCHNLPGKAVSYFIVVMFLWSQLTSQSILIDAQVEAIIKVELKQL